jgi:hypothetical protein
MCHATALAVFKPVSLSLKRITLTCWAHWLGPILQDLLIIIGVSFTAYWTSLSIYGLCINHTLRLFP